MAFIKHRGTALHAYKHRKASYALKVDIHDWFGSVTPFHLEEILKDRPQLLKEINKYCFINESARQEPFLPQGAPTSPALANIAARSLDHEIAEQVILKLHKNEDLGVISGIKYSRYADDLIISCENAAYPYEFFDVAYQILKDCIIKHGWKINHKKTQYWTYHRGGPLEICGIQITDDYKLRLPSSMRRKVRAAEHRLSSEDKSGFIDKKDLDQLIAQSMSKAAQYWQGPHDSSQLIQRLSADLLTQKAEDLIAQSYNKYIGTLAYAYSITGQLTHAPLFSQTWKTGISAIAKLLYPTQTIEQSEAQVRDFILGWRGTKKT